MGISVMSLAMAVATSISLRCLKTRPARVLSTAQPSIWDSHQKNARTHTEFYYQHVVSFSILTDLPSKDEWSLFDCTEI